MPAVPKTLISLVISKLLRFFTTIAWIEARYHKKNFGGLDRFVTSRQKTPWGEFTKTLTRFVLKSTLNLNEVMNVLNKIFK